MNFKEINTDIIDVIEYRKLGLIFRGWNCIKTFIKKGNTYFDLVTKKGNKKLGIVAVEKIEDIKELRNLRTYLKYVDEIEFLTIKNDVFEKIYEKFAGRKKWKVTIFTEHLGNFTFIHRK